jgi:hypothetical protein
MSTRVGIHNYQQTLKKEIFVRILYTSAVFFVLFFSTTASAKILSPTDVVRALIHAAHDGDMKSIGQLTDLKKISEGRHGMSEDELVSFLKRVDLHSLSFAQMRRSSQDLPLTNPSPETMKTLDCSLPVI